MDLSSDTLNAALDEWVRLQVLVVETTVRFADRHWFEWEQQRLH